MHNFIILPILTLITLSSASFSTLAAKPATGDPCAAIDGITTVSLSGDCNSIQAAIDSAPGTATSPTVINVSPGVYSETLTLKSHIRLQGAGKEATTLAADPALGAAVTIDSATNVHMSDFTIKPADTLNWNNAFYITNSSPVITDNRITEFGDYAFRTLNSTGSYKGNDILNISAGAFWTTNSSPTVIANTFKDIGYEGLYIDGTCANNVRVEDNRFTNIAYGSILWLCSTGHASIKNNHIETDGWHAIYTYNNADISNNIISNSWSGIYVTGSGSANPVNITGNVISGNTRNGVYTYAGGTANNVFVLHNKITNNNTSGGSFADVYAYPVGQPSHLSFNIYDTIAGSITPNIVGGYNLKSDGTPW